MPTWNYLKFEEPRPDFKVYEEGERGQLEALVAQQVVSLLSLYGSVVDTDYGVSAYPSGEYPTTYEAVQLDSEVLEDDSEFFVRQMPKTGDKWDISKGLYAIDQFDEDDLPVIELTVHDPTHHAKRRVHNSDGSRLNMDLLQEVHELLYLLTASYIINREINNPPLKPENYPILAENQAFDSTVN